MPKFNIDKRYSILEGNKCHRKINKSGKGNWQHVYEGKNMQSEIGLSKKQDLKEHVYIYRSCR